MIYAQCIVPLFMLFLILGTYSLDFKTHFQKNKVLIAAIGLIISINFFAWLLDLKLQFSLTEFYALFILGLILLFSDKKAVALMRIPVLFVLFLNLFFCTLESQLGLMSVYVNTFHDLYTSLSEFLTSKAGLVSNSQSIIRQLNEYIHFVRPSGLFSNLHLSSFALFCLFAYFNLQKKNRLLQAICVFLIVIGGTMQTMLCLIIYLFLCSISSFKKVSLISLFLIAPFSLYAFTIYGPQKAYQHNNMYRILTDSIMVFKSISLKSLIWGDSVDRIIDTAGAQFVHANMLIESGVLRYSLSIGFLNIALIVALFCGIYFKLKPKDKKPYYFLIATFGTYFHYFMTTTFIGSILVTFIFMSHQPDALVQDDRVN